VRTRARHTKCKVPGKLGKTDKRWRAKATGFSNGDVGALFGDDDEADEEVKSDYDFLSDGRFCIVSSRATNHGALMAYGQNDVLLGGAKGRGAEDGGQEREGYGVIGHDHRLHSDELKH